MRKKLYILLFLFSAISAFAQISQENGYKLTFPDNISSNSAFDISLVASNPFIEANRLILFFNPSPGINFRNLELRTFGNLTSIQCKQISIDERQGVVYRAEIDLKKNKITSQNYFQILLTFRADNVTAAEFGFSGIFKAGNKTLGYIQSSDNFDKEDTLKFSSVQLKFYRTQKLAVN